MPMDCTYVSKSANQLALDCSQSLVTGLGWWEIGGIALVGVLVFIGFCMWVFPVYGVWSAHKSGQADLAQAMNEQQIQIAEAQSRLNAAELNKKAAIIEAEAVAAQIVAIGEKLTEHDLYLKWQWIKMMEDRDSSSDTIYVPTEAGLPLLEATRRK